MAKNKKFAIIKLAGTQHLVKEGDILEVNRIDTEKDNKFSIPEVLLLQDGDDVNIGTPIIEGTKVDAKVLEHTRGPKINIRKFRAKSRYRKRQGHRQSLTKIEIVKIS